MRDRETTGSQAQDFSPKSKIQDPKSSACRLVVARVTAGMISVGGLLVVAACNTPIMDAVLDQTVDPVSRFGRPVAKQSAYAPTPFVNWETPHVSPIALTPDGSRLLAVNTPDNRLEVIQPLDPPLEDTGQPHPVGLLRQSIPVGLEPVSVRVRSDHEAWVVNHVSDSISIVDLDAGLVVETLLPGDEPTDVAFAGGRAFVVCSQLNRVMAYDLTDLAAPPTAIEIEGEDPRMAVVSAGGTKVLVTIFESGNGTTIVPMQSVSEPSGPYGGQNPPPGAGGVFTPALNPDLPAPPRLSLIVRRDRASGMWLDDNGADWSSFVTWDFHDHDVAIIDAATLGVQYVSGLMNLDMALAARSDGTAVVVGTEALNDVRYEPNLTAHFVKSTLAVIDPTTAGATTVLDLNPHLDGAIKAGTKTLPPAERAATIADPRGVVFERDGKVGYVTGMGSNSVAKIAADGSRIAQIDVGQGPTGLVLDESRGRLYVMNKFDASISVVDTAQFAESGRIAFFDPTPPAIKLGRPFLYDARRTSGLGLTSCGACHIDGRMDQIVWDLGNPAGEMKAFNQECEALIGAIDTSCDDFHPMKGPMATQTLQGIVGTEPLHWRGDRENLAAFNPAFVGLLGNDRQLTDEEMAAFEAFVSTLKFPPNPNRNPDNSLKTDVFGGNAVRGFDLFVNEPIDSAEGMAARKPDDPTSALFAMAGPIFSCNRCHQLPNGTNQRITSGTSLGREQGTKVPQLRNVYEKTGLRKDGGIGTRGFGFTHSGEFDTVDTFLHLPNFDFGRGAAGDRKRTDIISFVMSMSIDTHAGVGLQATVNARTRDDVATRERIDLMLTLADAGDVGLVVRGRLDGALRGFAYSGSGVFQSDRAGETIRSSELRDAGGEGAELTWTLVPLGAQVRIGIDRNMDGTLDADE
jgi:DNA-binding beta-propeller fold protein YncE